MGKEKIFNFKFDFEKDFGFKNAVKNLSDIYLEDNNAQMVINIEYLGNVDTGVVYIHELYWRLNECIKTERWLDFFYEEPIEFDNGYNFEIEDGKIFLRPMLGRWHIENIDVAKTFVKEFAQAIEEMILSIENGEKYLEELKGVEIKYLGGSSYSNICRTDFYKCMQKLKVEKWQYKDLYGSVELAEVGFDIDVYYIKLYADFVDQLDLFKRGEFKEYVYSDIVDSVDVFSIAKVEDEKYQLCYSGKNITLNKYTLHRLLSTYIEGFQNLCWGYGEKGQRLLHEIFIDVLTIK